MSPRSLCDPRLSNFSNAASAAGADQPRLSCSLSGTSQRISIVPPPSSISVRAQSRSSVNVSHIARPDLGSLVQTKTKRPEQIRGQDLDRPDAAVLSAARNSQTQNGIVLKEDALEAIMSAESQQGFLQMKMYALNKTHATRVAVDPAELANVDLLDYLVDGSDLEPPSHHCMDADLDTEYTDRHPLEVWSCSSQEFNAGAAEPPPWLDEGSLRIGVGFPSLGQWPVVGPDARDAPCQDRLFAARCGDFTLVGLANGHGKPRTSEALLGLIAERLPVALLQSAPFLHDDVAGGLICAFHQVHCEASRELDLHLAGAAVTVALADEQHVWVAHVGDCRAVLGVPDSNANAQAFHFCPSCLTTDHTLAAKGEFDRIREAGAECRKLVNDNVYRLYVQDNEVPGLTLTRALGDRLAHAVGVHHMPSVAMFERGSSSGSFLLMGTGAFWSVMSERTAVNWVSRRFASPAEAAASLADEAHRRWEEPECQAKRSLKGMLREHFASVVITFEPPEASRVMQPQRPFVTGPESKRDVQRGFDEVKHPGRTDELRRLQARLLHSQELAR